MLMIGTLPYQLTDLGLHGHVSRELSKLFRTSLVISEEQDRQESCVFEHTYVIPIKRKLSTNLVLLD